MLIKFWILLKHGDKTLSLYVSKEHFIAMGIAVDATCEGLSDALLILNRHGRRCDIFGDTEAGLRRLKETARLWAGVENDTP